MKKLSVLDCSYIALSAALIAICSWLSIPTTIPFTLQTFAVCLISALFGTKRGTLAVCVYILLGAVGIPVFSGFAGGIGVLLGTTGGYIIGFIFTAISVGLWLKRFGDGVFSLAVSMVLGIALCYVFGTAWFMFVYARTSGSIGLLTALSWCVFPYLIPDGLKILLAVILCRRLKPVIIKGDRHD